MEKARIILDYDRSLDNINFAKRRQVNSSCQEMLKCRLDSGSHPSFSRNYFSNYWNLYRKKWDKRKSKSRIWVFFNWYIMHISCYNQANSSWLHRRVRIRIFRIGRRVNFYSYSNLNWIDSCVCISNWNVLDDIFSWSGIHCCFNF